MSWSITGKYMNKQTSLLNLCYKISRTYNICNRTYGMLTFPFLFALYGIMLKLRKERFYRVKKHQCESTNRYCEKNTVSIQVQGPRRTSSDNIGMILYCSRATAKEKVEQRRGKEITRREKKMKEKEESRRKKKVPHLSPLKVTEMPGHLLRLHQIKCTHFHKCASTHYMHITVSPTALSTTDFTACLWWLCYRFTFFPFLALALFFDDHTFNKNRSLTKACACRWHAADEFLRHDITRSEANWIECKIVLSLQQLKQEYTNTATDIQDHNIMRL